MAFSAVGESTVHWHGLYSVWLLSTVFFEIYMCVEYTQQSRLFMFTELAPPPKELYIISMAVLVPSNAHHRNVCSYAAYMNQTHSYN